MYESTFCENNRKLLTDLLGGTQGCGYCSALTADKSIFQRDDELAQTAENWLNVHNIVTRTEYNNLLPTYHLLVEIGKYLKEHENVE